MGWTLISDWLSVMTVLRFLKAEHALSHAVVILLRHLMLCALVEFGTTAPSLASHVNHMRQIDPGAASMAKHTSTTPVHRNAGTIRRQPPECHTVEQYKANAGTYCDDPSEGTRDIFMKGNYEELALRHAYRQRLVPEPCRPCLGVCIRS